MLKEMFFEALQSYFAPLSTIIIFFIILITDKILTRKTKRLFIIECMVIVLIILATMFDRMLSVVTNSESAWKLRTITTFINFAVSPLSPLLLGFIYQKDEKLRTTKNYLFFIPAIVNILVCLASCFTGWVFEISKLNEYSRRGLFFLPFLVTAFYLISLIYLACKQKSKPDKKMEALFLASVTIVITIATLIEVIFVKRFIIWSTTLVCVVLYFLILCAQMILYDPLTGVYNRISYKRRLETIQDKGSDVMVAFIDLNNLKGFNDKFGHSFGDLAITTVAKCLIQAKTYQMKLYRFGGDEFIIIVPGDNEQQLENVLISAQGNCGSIGDVPLTFAYGIAKFNLGDNIDEVVETADMNMYEYKRLNLRNRNKDN